MNAFLIQKGTNALLHFCTNQQQLGHWTMEEDGAGGAGERWGWVILDQGIAIGPVKTSIVPSS
jgi:hypothetical protein